MSNKPASFYVGIALFIAALVAAMAANGSNNANNGFAGIVLAIIGGTFVLGSQRAATAR